MNSGLYLLICANKFLRFHRITVLLEFPLDFKHQKADCAPNSGRIGFWFLFFVEKQI